MIYMHCKSYSHFFSKKSQHICVSLDVNFSESLTNNVVSFEQLGPGQQYILSTENRRNLCFSDYAYSACVSLKIDQSILVNNARSCSKLSNTLLLLPKFFFVHVQCTLYLHPKIEYYTVCVCHFVNSCMKFYDSYHNIDVLIV